ncbi:hypothetical protein [uncultured Sphingomonas sp.]|uniref:hypothetical protein n=1 Tax=uncultured Sphingomonas sp. TaxID=158754 RepID=UPI0025D95758|nr:hypothetical protein [uncultured Sphingomonas sp.]
MWTIMLAVMASGAAADCARLEATLSTPIAITARQLSGQEVGGTLIRPAEPSVPATYQVGRLNYHGNGIAIHSSDRRFRGIVLDQAFGVHHRCGNPVSGPSGWNGGDPNIVTSTMRIEPVRARAVLAPAARMHGGTPYLRGQVLGATWPVFTDGGRFFLGLMHPRGRKQPTTLVAFPAQAGPGKTITLATIPLPLQTVSALPDLHFPTLYVDLHGRSSNRELVNVILSLEAWRASSLAAELR